MNEFTCENLFVDLYKRYGNRFAAPLQINDFSVWQNEAVKKLQDILRVSGCEKVENLATVFETRDVNKEYVREHLILRTAKDLWMTAFVLYKKNIVGRKPAFILPPPEGAGKFDLIWSDDYADVASADSLIRERICKNWEFTFALADKGYLVVVPDTIGEGERREWMDEGSQNFFKSSHRADNNVAIALGESLGGLIVYELKVLADYLETREDYSGKLSVGGKRSAADVSVFFAAIDKRVSTVFAQEWLYEIKEDIIKTRDVCSCTCVPNMWKYFDKSDLAEILFPTKLIICGSDDESLRKVKECYSTAENNFIGIEQHEVCQYLNKEALRFFD